LLRTSSRLASCETRKSKLSVVSMVFQTRGVEDCDQWRHSDRDCKRPPRRADRKNCRRRESRHAICGGRQKAFVILSGLSRQRNGVEGSLAFTITIPLRSESRGCIVEKVDRVEGLRNTALRVMTDFQSEIIEFGKHARADGARGTHNLQIYHSRCRSES
jgi:hypothetical protein